MRYVLRVSLIESPNVVFYYKGIECHEAVTKALNTVVAFVMEDALVLEKDEAIKLCNELNSDKDSLVGSGFTIFECVPIITEKSQ